VEDAVVFAGSDIFAEKFYIDLVFGSRRVDRQLDIEKLSPRDKLQAFSAKFNRLDMSGHGLMAQVAAQKHVNLSRGKVRIEKGENQCLFLMDNLVHDPGVQQGPRIDGNSRLETQLFHNRKKLGKVGRICGHGNIHIHRDSFDTVQDARHAAAHDEIDVSIDQGSQNLFVVAHVKGIRTSGGEER
jgi:hypothetical protein